MTLSTSVRKAVSRVTWRPPTFSMPMAYPSPPADWQPLGEIRGRRWWRAKFGELEATGTEFESSREFPNGPVLVRREGDRELVQLLKVHAPGTFERVSAPRIAAPERARLEFRVLDGDTIVPLTGGQPVDALHSLARTSTVATGGYAERHRIVGAPAIARHLSGKSVAVALPYLTVARALLGPFLASGTAPSCAFGCGREAVTVAEAAPEPVAWCGQWPCAKEGR
jgi:hypothetical protein